jgi:hypothetical protein
MKLAHFDKQAFRLLPQVDGKLLAYAREHRDEILVPERAQAG